MATARNICNNCLQALGDLGSERWGIDEMLRYFNRAHRRLAQKTQCYRRLDSVATYSADGVFLCSEDVHYVLEVFYNGVPLRYTNRFTLKEEDENYQTKKGTPESWWRGFSGPREIRLYPVPSDLSPIGSDVVDFGEEEYGVISSISLEDEYVEFDTDYGMIASVNDTSDQPFAIASSYEGNAGELAVLYVAGTIQVAVSHLPKWTQMGDIDDVLDIPEVIEETLEYGILARALRKIGRDEDMRKAREYDMLFEEYIREHEADQNVDHAEQEVYVDPHYI